VLSRPLPSGVCEGEDEVMDLHGLDALPCTCPLSSPPPPKPSTPQRGATGASPAKAPPTPATASNGSAPLSQLYLILHAHAFLLAAPHR
jgi:hypothetical protein